MTIQRYETEPYLRELATRIVEVGREDGRNFAVLEETLFYPEGGGQPADQGSIGPAPVIDVQKTDDGIRHFLDRPVETGPTRLVLDWRRRYDHMQQHTAQHLLTAVAADRFGWQTTSFHLGDKHCDIELDTPKIGQIDLERLESAIAEEVRAARPVTVRWVSLDEYQRIDELRSRGLPRGFRGDVRLVEIAGIDLNTCGGTHLASTAEIETLKLIATEPMRGGTRLHWIAGARVRDRIGDLERITAELRGLFETSENELFATATLKRDQLRHAGRVTRGLRNRLAVLEGSDLANATDSVVSRNFEHADLPFLQAIARSFLEQDLSTATVALLTGSTEKGAFFLLASRDDAVDLCQLGPRVAAMLEGRGGGTGNLYQGRAGSLEQRQKALEIVMHELSKA